MSLFSKKPIATDVPPEGRRRPITNSDQASRPQAFSYYAGRPQDQNHAVRQPVEARHEPGHDQPVALAPGRKALMYAGGIVAFAGFIYLLSLSPNATIITNTDASSATFLQEPAVYQRAATRYLAATPLSLSKLTVDTTGLSDAMTNAYPELRTADVSLPLVGRRPVVKITPYQAAFIVTTPQSSAYLLDANGRALASASQLDTAATADLPTVQVMGSTAIKTGEQALPAPTVAFIRQIIAVLDVAHVSTTTLQLPAGTSEFDAHISGKPYYVKFNVRGDAKLQAGTFLAAGKRLQDDHITPAQYIDVRVPERAYYK